MQARIHANANGQQTQYQADVTLPSRGCLGIHNRSWYEEVLVVRVHPNFLDAQKLPDSVRSKRIFDERLEDIAAVERYLARQGTAILKIYLHVSQKEQKKRFLARIEEPDRNWKFSAADVAERQYWDEYMDAYEQAIRRTAAPHAPWYVIPADNKWFTRLAVAGAMIVTMDALELAYPKLPKSARETAGCEATAAGPFQKKYNAPSAEGLEHS